MTKPVKQWLPEYDCPLLLVTSKTVQVWNIYKSPSSWWWWGLGNAALKVVRLFLTAKSKTLSTISERCLTELNWILQAPGGNNGQAAADGAAAQNPADPAPDGLAAANQHEAGNQEDEAELNDEEEDDDGDEDEEEEDDEEGREEDAADANNGGQGQCENKNRGFLLHSCLRLSSFSHISVRGPEPHCDLGLTLYFLVNW